MSFDLDNLNKIFEFCSYVIGIGGFLYGGWRMIIAPIKKIYNKIENIEESTKSNNKIIHEEVVEICQSILKELNSRTFQLRDFIQWERFIQGV